MKIPSTAPPEIQQSFREVYLALDPWAGGKNIDLKGRRLMNAGAAVADSDYVTLGELREQVQGPLAAITAGVQADANRLIGVTLAPNVINSSLRNFGTLNANLLFTDATYDIGLTGATRPRHLYLSGAANVQTVSDASALVVAPIHATYTSDAISVNTTRASNSAFNLLHLKANSVALCLVRGDGQTTISPTDNITALQVTPSYATYEGTAIFANTTRAANSAFNLMSLNANSVVQFSVRGDGLVSFGTHSALGAETVSGYITINDAAGNSRKVAVVS